jgi:hypothetical protein
MSRLLMPAPMSVLRGSMLRGSPLWRLVLGLAWVFLLLVPVDVFADDTYAWSLPGAEEQLAADQTIIPVGKGAVFVPSISGPEHEPPATIVTGDEVITVPPGQRVLLDPGPYVVVVSSGTPSQGVGVAIEVVEGETVLVPVRWGALQIEVTDQNRIPHRGAYEIIRSDTREPVGMGFGTDTLQGEILQTWLLPPGLYRITRPGRNTRTLVDTVTVQVPEAGFVRYRLIQDEATGDLLGAGVLQPNDPSTGERRSLGSWRPSLNVGANGTMVHNQNVVGAFNQTQFTGTAFIDGQAIYSEDAHRLSILLQVEEGVSQIRPQDGEPLPLVKATDRLRFDTLYSWSFRRDAGPYARVSAQTQAFPTEVLVSEDTTIRTRDARGVVLSSFDIDANESFRLANAWSPTLLREGIGINKSFAKKARSNAFNLRLGYGMRQNIYDGALVLDDLPDTQALEYTAVESFYEQGIETTVVASVRLPGWVVYSTNLEIFADFGSFTRSWNRTERGNLPYPPWAINWRNTVALRLTRNLSLNYFANISIEPKVIDRPQVQQSLLLRAAWSIF